MIIDKDEDAVQRMAPFVTASHIGDCQDPDVIKELGVNNFDICFVCISNDFQGSLEVTYALKENGAHHVVSRADRDSQTKFLQKIGADEVIHPEKEMAQRMAMHYNANNTFEYFELTPEYAISEILVPSDWVGKSIAEVNVRLKYNINIIGVKNSGSIVPMLSSNHVFKQSEHLIIAGSKKDSIRFTEKKCQ